MNKVRTLPVHVQDVRQHPEYQTWDGEDLCDGPKAQLTGKGDKKGENKQP
jgi:hypothetical protein